MSGAGSIELLSLVSTGWHVLLALALAIVCFVYSKRLGTAGAVILGVLSLVDLVDAVVWRVAILGSRTMPLEQVDALLAGLSAVSILESLLSIGGFLLAFWLMRNPPLDSP